MSSQVQWNSIDYSGVASLCCYYYNRRGGENTPLTIYMVCALVPRQHVTCPVTHRPHDSQQYSS